MKKMMSSILSGLLICGILGTGAQTEATNMNNASLIKTVVLLNGKALEFSQEPVLVHNRLLVPSETFAREIGAKMTYDQVNKTIRIIKGSNIYLLPIGSNAANFNGTTVSLDVSAAIINQVPYVPLRFVSENLGLKVGYSQETRTVSLKANDNPSFKVISPSQDDILYTNQVKISIASFNHELVDFRQQKQPQNGKGHIHLWLDTDPSNPMLAYKMIDGEPAVFENVQPGDHTLTVQLVGNDHKPITPEVKQVITFTTATTPSLAIKGPKEGETIFGDKVTVTSELTGFKFLDFRTKSEVAVEEGHLHLWLDTDITNPKLAYKQISEKPVIFENIKPGDHTLTVQLVGANHKPIVPAVKEVVKFKTAAHPSQKTEKTSTKPANPAKTYTVNIESFAFKPGSLTVEVGSTITFNNLDDVDHTVSAKDESFNSGNIGKGRSYTMTFKKEGEYHIYCKPHNFMVGMITVK
ncbi:stalk domain-containing protein [Ammoniphilus sp. 3BR4]|uniref:stalk domain-containing protein n=1 Tax=Ammoniphilus sp. 3BR4 TaxID=3158265 RepID=UPI0034670A6C